MIYVYAFFFFLVALIYSAAGFGGGSMYLAILAQAALPVQTVRMTALTCNAIVTAGGTWQFHKSNWIVWRGVLPLLACSVPPCLFAASLELTEKTYYISLAISLLIAAGFMLWRRPIAEDSVARPTRWWMYPLSFLIGGISGITGIGGGIYLAPFLYLTSWGSPKQIAGASSAFILVNSIAGLCMQIFAHGWCIEADAWPLPVAVFAGGLLGSRFSSARFTHESIRRVTVVIIIFAAIRTLWKYL